jgi:hypothetical protein
MVSNIVEKPGDKPGFLFFIYREGNGEGDEEMRSGDLDPIGPPHIHHFTIV